MDKNLEDRYFYYKENICKKTFNRKEMNLYLQKDKSLLKKEEVIESCLMIVLYVVKSFITNNNAQNFRYSFDDLFEEGVLALSHAYDLYDYKKSKDFFAYATTSIYNHLKKQLIKKEQMITMPNWKYDFNNICVSDIEFLPDVMCEQNYLSNEFDKMLKKALIGKELKKYTWEELKNIYEFCRLYRLINNPKTENKDEYVLEFYYVLDKFLTNDSNKTLDEMFLENKAVYLKLRNYDIITKRYMNDKPLCYTLEDLAKIHGCTIQQINLSEIYSLQLLRKYFYAHKTDFEEYGDIKKLAKKYFNSSYKK